MSLAALAPIVGWPISRLRERWEALCPNPSGRDEQSTGVLDRGVKSGKGVLGKEVRETCSQPDRRDGTSVAHLQSQIEQCVWELSLLDSQMPPEVWGLLRLECEAGDAMWGVRQRLREVETAMLQLEGRMQKGGLDTLSIREHATDSRQFIFRIDDITHSLQGRSAGGVRNHLPIPAVNEVDGDLFPDFVYLHSSIGGEGVVLDADTEFLTGCACGGECDHRSGCACCREQIHQTGGNAYDEEGLLQALKIALVLEGGGRELRCCSVAYTITLK